MSDRCLNIGIDARAVSHPQRGGFKSYVTNLLEGLATVDRENNYRIYVDRALPPQSPRLPARSTVEVVGEGARGVGVVWREQVMLPIRQSAQRIDVAHFPTSTSSIWRSCPRVVTIHDAIEYLSSARTGAVPAAWHTRRGAMRLYSRLCQLAAARTATLILTPSECSRRDVVRYMGVSDRKIRVIPEAPAPLFHPPSATEGEDTPLLRAGPFVLAIGSADPRKNLAGLFRAYAALPPELIGRYRLVVVWTHDRLRESLIDLAKRLGIGERITSVVGASDDELCQIYGAATVFAFPSLYEGFGLPPLEAMACGTPVIASNTSSLPEVLGDGAILVDPRSTQELSQALANVLSDAGLRTRLRQGGWERVKQFSWERTARLTVAAYAEAAASEDGRAQSIGFAGSRSGRV